jgi:hypothetical protein
VYLEIGPASLVVEGRKDGKGFEFDRTELENRIKVILEEIRDALPILKQKAYRIKKASHLPLVARRMIEAVRIVDEATLTPMAAVAGTLSDEVKEFLRSKDLDMISVNNGGDISIFTRETRPFRIGIGDMDGGIRTASHVLKIGGLIDYGLATSGYGGRSFTLGLADMGTVVAESGAIADAAATFICNRTNVESEKVMREQASKIDPLTDIPDELVTVGIGELDRGLVFEALEKGIDAAHVLKEAHVIYDALIVLKGEMATTLRGDIPITLEVDHGN